MQGKEAPTVTTETTCAEFKGRFRNQETKEIKCKTVMRGSHVAIVKAPPNPLAFCEFEVIGHSYKGKNKYCLALVSSFIQVFNSSLCNNNINDDDDYDDDR